MAYLALSPTPSIRIHSSMVTNNAATNTRTIELFGDNFSILLSPYVDDDISLAETTLFDGQLPLLLGSTIIGLIALLVF